MEGKPAQSLFTPDHSQVIVQESHDSHHCDTFNIRHGEGGAPVLEILQYQVDAWSGRSKPLFHLPVPKINLIYGPRVGDVSDSKLIRTDTTLDLSQKAEKRYWRHVGGHVLLLLTVPLCERSEVWTQSRLEPPPGPLPVSMFTAGG